MDNKLYRVTIIEPSPIVQTGLQSIIAAMPNFDVVGILLDMNRLSEKIAAQQADLIIINPSIIEFHKRNSIKSNFEEIPLVALLYNYIDNDILRQFNGVIDIYDEQSKIAATLQQAVAKYAKDELAPEGNELSDREKEIVVAVAKGLMNKEIAAEHNISIHTVISHRRNISRKTGIKSASGFVVYALLNNLIEQSDIHY